MHDQEFQQRLQATFRVEAAEHLQAMTQAAAALGPGVDAEVARALLERIYRETHTLKGAARMVAEGAAESLCHALEQQLVALKQADGPPGPGETAALADTIAAIGRALALEPSALAVAPPTSAPLPAASNEVPQTSAAPAPAPVAGQIRVSSARLDALLARTEELVGAKLTGGVRAATLRELRERGTAWRRDWDGVRTELAALRRYVDGAAGAPMEKELRALLQYAEASHEFGRAWQRDLAKLAADVSADQRKLGLTVDQLLQDTKEVLMQPFSALLELFPAFVRDIARQQGKEIEIEITGGETEIDRRVLDETKDALMHLVRNAVDHGIEAVAERRAAGKPPRARVAIAVAERSGGNVEIVVRDDGRGIDPATLVESARRLQLVAPDAELSDAEALALIFASGFSTRAAATALSGRGLGLAIVREKVEQLGGSVQVESAAGKGATFRLLLPVAFARFRGVFVQAGRQTFVLPSSYVVRILRLPPSAVRRVKHQQVLDIDDRAHVVLALPELLGVGTPRKTGGDEKAPVFFVLVQSGGARAALRVDGVPFEEPIVMKSLGRLLRRGRRYVGATVRGGEQIVPVLNVADLLGATARRAPRAGGGGPGGAGAVERRRRTILVAEDSITSRSLLKNILQTAGFDVRTAVDGADALTTLKFEAVDLLISDVQMPRVDGFELTARVRSDPKLSTLPVILITSLASREDKARGVDAGANAYIVKSSFDQSDLLAAIGRLLP